MATAADAAPGGRDALKASMKQLLQAKMAAKGGGKKGDAKRDADPVAVAAGYPSGASAPASASDAPVAAAAVVEEEEEEDPWPDLPLSMTNLGVEDGQRRARELEMRLNYESAARMWAKALYVARRCAAPLPGGCLAELALGQATALQRVEDWAKSASVCSRALAQPPADDALWLQLLLCRARSRAELRDEDGACADLKQVRGHIGSGPHDALEEVEDVEQRLADVLRQPAPAVASEAQPVGGLDTLDGLDGGLNTLDGLDGVEPDNSKVARKTQEAEPDKSEAARKNQEFFDEMEKEYTASCEADGWDEVRKKQDELKSEVVGTTGPAASRIPASSDYFRVCVPGRDRELRRPLSGEELPRSGPAAAPDGSRPRRNLDELRRVEAETREAMEAERARRAMLEKEKDGSESEPQSAPTNPKAGLDSIFDSGDEDGDDAVPEEEKQKAQQLYEALENFQRLGREKEERLAKWRDRWG